MYTERERETEAESATAYSRFDVFVRRTAIWRRTTTTVHIYNITTTLDNARDVCFAHPHRPPPKMPRLSVLVY